MTLDLDNVPAPELADNRQDAIYAALLATITAELELRHRPWARRHHKLAAGACALVVLGSTSTALATRYLSGTAAPSNSLFCYSQVSSDTGKNAPGSGAGLAAATPVAGSGQPDPGPALITDPVGLCADLYRDGSLKLGVAHEPGSAVLDTNDPVPPLTACVRSDGTVAVEPGGASVCAEVGMALFTGYGPPAPTPSPS